METRTVKNVCAPAAVIEDKIYIIGGELDIKLYCYYKKKYSEIINKRTFLLNLLFCPLKGTQEG